MSGYRLPGILLVYSPERHDQLAGARAAKGRGWVEKILGWSVDLVERLRKPAPEGVLKSWAEQWQ